LKHVVVAIDASNIARGALVVGLSWASALRAHKTTDGTPTKLTTLNVRASSEPRPTELEAEIERIRVDAGSWAGVSIEPVRVSDDSAVAGIVRYASEHDTSVVVLGTRGVGAHRVGGLGSVSAGVMMRLDTPVLLVPPAIWRSHASE
jgi:nucleotide-binding universal stress UspA family protein